MKGGEGGREGRRGGEGRRGEGRGCEGRGCEGREGKVEGK